MAERFILAVEGPNLEDIEEIELLRLPTEGEPIQTRYGTCIVTRLETMPAGTPYSGKIVCRLP
jgi:hypothetical protein